MKNDEFIVSGFTEKELSLLGTDKKSQQKQIKKILKQQLKQARKKFNQSLLGTDNDKAGV